MSDISGSPRHASGAGVPEDMAILIAPFAVQPSDDTELQPDLLVVRSVT
jgi:hypothetical protein